MNDKIILMGFMGCGKSTIGRTLADKLGCKFVDLDDEIEKEAKKTISKIFESKGEAYFRRLESKVLKTTLARKEGMVLALGGGTPCFNNNLKLIAKFPSFYIKCGIDVLAKRLKKEKAHRPVIVGQKSSELSSFISKKLSQRRVFYNQASYTVMGARPVVSIVNRIVALVSI